MFKGSVAEAESLFYWSIYFNYTFHYFVWITHYLSDVQITMHKFIFIYITKILDSNELFMRDSVVFYEKRSSSALSVYQVYYNIALVRIAQFMRVCFRRFSLAAESTHNEKAYVRLTICKISYFRNAGSILVWQ